MSRTEVKVGGFGGQGIILSGYIIGKAASIHDKKNATLTQAYGPEARGGACSTNVIVSDDVVDYPKLMKADVLVAMSQEAYTKFLPLIAPGGMLLVEDDLVDLTSATPPAGVTVYAIPATRMADELGKRIVANIIMLGFFAATTDVVSFEAMKESIAGSVPPGTQELNLKAFMAGYEYGETLVKGV